MLTERMRPFETAAGKIFFRRKNIICRTAKIVPTGSKNNSAEENAILPTAAAAFNSKGPKAADAVRAGKRA